MTDVAKVTADLSAIQRLAEDLPEQAEHQANSRVMMGGDALANMAPVTNLERWAWQQDAAEEAALRGDRSWPTLEHEDDEDVPVLQALLFWSEQRRREEGHELDGRTPTVATEAAFLRYYADAMWRDEPGWDDYAADVSKARRKLENVLKAGKREQISRVACDKVECEGRHLIMLVGETPEQDQWKCTSCHRKFGHEDYKRAAATQLRRSEASRFVRQTEAVAVLRERQMPAKTIRNWLGAPLKHVKNRCPDCGRTWAVEERDPTLCDCGVPLVKVFKGNAENVVEGYCDVRTRQTFLWWPDLWTKHLQWRNRDALTKKAS